MGYSRRFDGGQPLPVDPDKQTFSGSVCMFSNVPISELGALWRRARRSCAAAAAANRTWPAPGGTNCPEGRSYQALFQDPEPKLDLCRPTLRTTARIPWLCIGTRMRRTMVRRSIHHS